MTTKRTHVSVDHAHWVTHTRAERQTKMTRRDSPQPFHDGCLPHEVTSDLLPLPIVHAHGGDQLQHHDLPTIPMLQHGPVTQVVHVISRSEWACTVFSLHITPCVR